MVVRCGPSTVLGTTTPARKAIVHTVMTTNPNQAAAETRSWTRRRDMSPCSGPGSPLRSRGTTSLVRVSRDVPGCDLGAGPESEPQPDALEVRLGGSFGDAQAVGQLAVRGAVRHEGRDFCLAGGQAGGNRPSQPGQSEEPSYLSDHRLHISDGRKVRAARELH